MTIQDYLEQNNVTLDQCNSLEFLKTHPNATLPTRVHDNLAYGDSGYDVSAVEDVVIPARGTALVATGLTLANLPPGIWIRIESRSGLAFKHNVHAFNGIIDNNYRGDLGIKLINHSDVDYHVKSGDRIAQLVLYPLVVVIRSIFTDNITATDRGSNGFGSTGQ